MLYVNNTDAIAVERDPQDDSRVIVGFRVSGMFANTNRHPGSSWAVAGLRGIVERSLSDSVAKGVGFQSFRIGDCPHNESAVRVDGPMVAQRVHVVQTLLVGFSTGDPFDDGDVVHFECAVGPSGATSYPASDFVVRRVNATPSAYRSSAPDLHLSLIGTDETRDASDDERIDVWRASIRCSVAVDPVLLRERHNMTTYANTLASYYGTAVINGAFDSIVKHTEDNGSAFGLRAYPDPSGILGLDDQVFLVTMEVSMYPGTDEARSREAVVRELKANFARDYDAQFASGGAIRADQPEIVDISVSYQGSV